MFEITLKFLESVQRNNSTEWLHTYRDLYQQEKKRFFDFMEKLLNDAKKLNPLLEDLEVKDCIYRFNKDIRFSRDKRPYKENFGGILAYGGKKSRYPCFYFNLQPGDKSFITGGVYYPSQINENKVRVYLLKHFDKRENFLKDKKIMGYYSFDEAQHQYKTTSRLKQLIKKNPEIKKEINPTIMEYLNLKNQGMMADDNYSIDILKQLAYYKDRTFSHALSDKTICSPSLYDEIFEAYKLILPIINFFEDAFDGPEYLC